MSDPFVDKTLRLLGDILGISGKTIQTKEEFPPEQRRVPFDTTAPPEAGPDMVRYGGDAVKGPGFFGPIPMTGEHEGNHMSELSVGHPDMPGGLYPLIVPGMPQSALDHLAGGGAATDEDYRRAEKSRDKRLDQGLSPFRSHKERQHEPVDDRQEYIPGSLENVARDAGLASDDPYQLEAKLEAWKQRGYQP